MLSEYNDLFSPKLKLTNASHHHQGKTLASLLPSVFGQKVKSSITLTTWLVSSK
jgi:hypothetical protein